MRVLVCGGRDFKDFDFLDRALSRFFWERELIHADCTIIHGCARGADRMAQRWVRERSYGMQEAPYPADWDTHGKAAGPIRNRQMLREGKPDIVIAFPGGKGTANMVKIAQDAGVEVLKLALK